MLTKNHLNCKQLANLKETIIRHLLYLCGLQKHICSTIKKVKWYLLLLMVSRVPEITNDVGINWLTKEAHGVYIWTLCTDNAPEALLLQGTIRLVQMGLAIAVHHAPLTVQNTKAVAETEHSIITVSLFAIKRKKKNPTILSWLVSVLCTFYSATWWRLASCKRFSFGLQCYFCRKDTDVNRDFFEW